MTKPRTLILAIIIALVTGVFFGYLLGVIAGTVKEIHALEDSLKWRDECDSLKEWNKHIDIELEVNRRIYELNEMNMGKWITIEDSLEGK